MIVERNKDELLIRLKLGKSSEKIQTLLDYLRYEEITANSLVSEESVQDLMVEVKKERFEKSRSNLGL